MDIVHFYALKELISNLMPATGLKIVGTDACLPWCSISSSFHNRLKKPGHRASKIVKFWCWNLVPFLQMPTKALSCKKEAICEHCPEAPPCHVGQGSFKMDCFKVEKSMVRRVKIWHSCWKSRTPCPPGLRGGRPSSVLSVFSSKASISDGMGCISAYAMGSLHVLEGTMNAERYIKVLEQHVLPSRRCLFQGRPCVFH